MPHIANIYLTVKTQNSTLVVDKCVDKVIFSLLSFSNFITSLSTRVINHKYLMKFCERKAPRVCRRYQEDLS